ncbi:hypothetical protein M514_23956 [Trichuris suis]|uniref:Reverse transcriptase domain-containing protein n=1 Tax=Trichuris suis TaxID=68888 RepID=A0A085N2W2_9BILA|nr:hypothetical protein M514_23956 [Trichuris suis]KHJ43374.1 hypothetical protein D918_06609 [Trichuris suis]
MNWTKVRSDYGANRPFRLFQYQRLHFGVSSAPAVFQQFMAQLISDVLGCAAYLYDVIVTGNDVAEHVQNLELLCGRFNAAGLHCKLEKCTFFSSSVDYVGHIISAQCITPSERDVQANKQLLRPRNVHELHVFIDKVNYYARFLDDFSDDCTILNALRKKNVTAWTAEHQFAFECLKEKIVNATSLVHFREDPQSPWPQMRRTMVRAVCFRTGIRMGPNDPSPTHSSKTLSAKQKGYSQVEKEGVAVMFGVRRLHQYLYGRHFELHTDHKPSVSIFSPSEAPPVMAAQRLQRWAIALMVYSFSIKYKCGNEHNDADALSRLPMGPDIEFDRSEVH